MRNHLQRLILTAVIAIALQSQAAMAQSLITVPPTPEEIRVPQGNKAFLKGHAVGTQNFICQATESGFTWRFLAPQATLFFIFQFFNNDVAQQITTHFLSPNPAENGTARPTWQSSLDTSSVWGRARASSIDPNFVAPGAIPWLLLEAAGTQAGPTNGTTLSQTTFIHRLNTSGGLPPAGGCSQTANVGTLAFMPYTADYYFYKAGN